MIAPGPLIKDARESAGFSQAELARRMDTTQSSVARLESPRSNPRLDTLDRAIAATGQRLAISVEPGFGLDETMVAANLRLEPADRLRHFASAHASARKLREAGKKALGS